MADSDTDRTLALAGVYQAAVLVDRCAHTGNLDPDAFSASIGSVLRIDAPDTATVYGGPQGVAMGLRTLVDHLDKRSSRDPVISRYVISMLHLERRLHKNPDMVDTIATGIKAAQRQADHFESHTHTSVVGALAAIYEETFSTLRFRVQVSGDQNRLSVPDNVNKVRAALLAGIRSAVLYRQCGGRTWTLLFRRGLTLKTARDLLGTLDE